MLCSEFELQLTDYFDGSLDPESSRLVGEHALRCPVCHETLMAVKSSLEACRIGTIPAPSREFEARILQKTVPETVMTCKDFEEYLTDYLDGFLPANLYHRWERHAALCDNCTELPGVVVRSIGACYTYMAEEMPVPDGLNERILQATLGTVLPHEVKAPWTSRVASAMRLWLDPIVSPQLASVATMLLVAILVMANTVSVDGSIRGVYDAGLQLAERTNGNANSDIRLVTGEKEKPVNEQPPPPPAQKPTAEPQQKDQNKSATKPNGNGQNNH